MAFQAGAIVSKLTLDKTNFSAAVQGVKKQTAAMGSWVKQNSAQFKGLGLAIAAMGTAAVVTFKKMIGKYVEVGDWIDKMSKRTGFSATALSELAYAADISGASLSDVEKGVKRMARTITDAGEGLESYLRPLQRIGLEVADLKKMNPEQQFMAITEAIAELEDPTLRAATAQEIFGRAGTMLLPLMADGKEGLKKLREEAHRLGIVFDEEAAAKAAALKDAQTALKKSLEGLGFAIAQDFIPVLTTMAQHFTDVFVDVRGNAKNFASSILQFFKTIAFGIQGLSLAWSGFKWLVYESAGYVAGQIRKLVYALVAQLVVLEKIPIVGKKIVPITDAMWEAFKALDAITEDYTKTAENQGETMADIRQKYEGFIAMLDKAGGAFTRLKTKSKETTKETVEDFGELAGSIDLGPAFTKMGMSMDEFKEFYKKWLQNLVDEGERKWQKMLGWASYFTNQLSGIFNQLYSNRMQQIENEYEAQKATIESSSASEEQKAALMERLDKKIEAERKKALRSQAKATKATALMEAIVNTASAVVEALPNIPLSILVGIMGAVQIGTILAAPLPSFKEGGDVPEDMFAQLHRGEKVLSAEEVREGGMGPKFYFNIAPVFQTNAVDEYAVQRFIEQKGAPALLEMLKDGILLPEFQKILGTR